MTIPEGAHFTGASCPHCGKPKYLATAADGEDAAPSPGDCTICITCGEWSIFDERMEMRLPTVEELDEMQADPAVQRADMAWRKTFR